MAIALTGTGGLFTRLGRIGKAVYDFNAYQGTTLVTSTNNILAQYASDQDLVEGVNAALVGNQASVGSLSGYLVQLATNTVNGMVYDDNPQPSKTDIKTSLQELIRQMKASSDSVKAATVAGSAASSLTYGNGTCVVSVKGGDGLSLENLLAEDILVKVTTDSSSSSSLSGNETFTLSGEAAADSVWSQTWPDGSGASTTTSVINGPSDNSKSNLLTNSDFETFTLAHTPDNWPIDVGSAGTQVKRQSSTVYRGTYCLEFAGDGTTLTTVSQTFNLSTGTLGTLSPQTVYHWAVWLRVSAAATGVLRVALVNSGNTVINDDAGTANSSTKDVSTLSDSAWTVFSGSFRTPWVVPSTVKLQLKMSTTLQNAKSLYIDNLSFGKAKQVYAGGPYISLHSGASAFYIPDYFTVTTTNNRGGVSDLRTFQTLFDRLFNMRSLGLLLPSSGSNTINDNLIA